MTVEEEEPDLEMWPVGEEPPVYAMWPGLDWRLEEVNGRHAHVTVFDHGAFAGRLVLDRATWQALTQFGGRSRVT